MVAITSDIKLGKKRTSHHEPCRLIRIVQLLSPSDNTFFDKTQKIHQITAITKLPHFLQYQKSPAALPPLEKF
jgi:hypothetical protein